MTRTIGTHPADLFGLIHTREGYVHIGRDLSYKFFTDHGTHTVYCCFQGSNGARDWWHNFMAMPGKGAGDRSAEPYRGCGWRVHAGFARVWRSGNETVMAEARELHGKWARSRPLPGGRWGAYDMVFCGYSHGAALAQLAGENWRFLHGGPTSGTRVITFGSPKLAWGDRAAFHLQSALDLTAWINRADIVTAVPPRSWGFRHVREDLVNVRRIPVLSKLRVRKHHERVYGMRSVYPV